MKLVTLAIISLLLSGSVFAAQSDQAAILQNNCYGGNAVACGSLGSMYEVGQGVNQDYFKAVELYQKACDGEYAQGCFSLGMRYELGQGIRQSKSEALRYYGKACDLKSKEGCEDYARLNTGR